MTNHLHQCDYTWHAVCLSLNAAVKNNLNNNTIRTSKMNMKKHAFYSILAVVSLLGLGMTQSAKANFVETISQVGSNVVATGNGAIDLAGLTFAFNGGGSVGIDASIGYINAGSGSGDVYGGYTGPANFGSGGFFPPDFTSGDSVALSVSQNLLLVPTGYLSNTALSDSMTFNNETLAAMGLTPGTYVWSWGDGPNQNFTLEIGGSVPDSGSTVSLLGCALLGLAMLRRKLSC
jgi:hypothetical protein